MTCKHRDDDPACSSYEDRKRQADETFLTRVAKEGWSKASDSPDAARFEIEEVEEIGGHLVLKVKYPSCATCAFEGSKVMVFLNTAVKQVLRWKKIDPHFRDCEGFPSATEAPSPAARFPASDEGWKDALAYARSRPTAR